MAADSSPDLSLRDVTKVYPGGLKANECVSLEIQSGEVFGLLGPNGAGKTTLVNQIVGLLKPTSGEIHLGETDLVRHPDAARRLCSLLPQANVPIEYLPAGKAVELMGRIRGGEKQTVRRRTDELFQVLEIEAWRGKRGGQLSGGVRRLVGYLLATVWPAQLIILDEPTNDVDPLRRRLLWWEIRRLAEGGSSVLLVTHNVLEAARSVDRLAILNHGRILSEGTPGSLKKADGDRLRLELTLEPRAPVPWLPAFLERGTQAGRRLLLHTAKKDAGKALEWAREMIQAGTAEDFEIGPTTLEDAYLRLIGREDATVIGDGKHE
jgi:ABC-2 type transport system ATP-binding protein